MINTMDDSNYIKQKDVLTLFRDNDSIKQKDINNAFKKESKDSVRVSVSYALKRLKSKGLIYYTEEEGTYSIPEKTWHLTTDGHEFITKELAKKE